MTDLYLLDPAVAPEWSPFQDARPVAELRAGAWLIRERWEAIADGETQAVFGPLHLHGFTEPGAAQVTTLKPVNGPALIGRSEFAPSGEPVEFGNAPLTLVNDDVPVGWWVPAGSTWEGPDAWGESAEIHGLLLRGAFDLITALEHLLHADATDFIQEQSDPVPDGSFVIGEAHEVVVMQAAVEPGVTFDLRHGAVVLAPGVYVKGGTRLAGPLYIGPDTEVLGGEIGWCAVGPRCKIRGELSHAVFLGYGNKAHDGFVGHSVIGRWANLGAGTVTSNLKNTYGNVRLDIAGTRIETERQLLGSLIGDHAKTAIGTLLPTGAVMGIGASWFGGVRSPKYVEPFSWGEEGVMNLDGFVGVVERVMPRRQEKLTDELRAFLKQVYANSVRHPR